MRASWSGRTRLLTAVIAVVFACAAGAGAAAYYAKQQFRLNQRAIALTGGDPKKAPELIIQFGCAGCHQIPGIRGPAGKIGPPLANVGSRIYLGGRVVNTPKTLVDWIADPHQLDPASAMPTTGISREEARDVAAYLLALRQ
jgi:cytochrome c1